jgi:hypothetical protein
MQKMDNVSQMIVQDGQVNNPREIADGFNKYFLIAAGEI